MKNQIKWIIKMDELIVIEQKETYRWRNKIDKVKRLIIIQD